MEQKIISRSRIWLKQNLKTRGTGRQAEAGGALKELLVELEGQ